jgi:hypothetical protein
VRSGAGHRLGGALLGPRRAIPREGRLLAARGGEEGVGVGLVERPLLAGLRDAGQPLGPQQQAQQRALVVADRAAHRAWKLRAQRRVQVSGEQDVEHAVLVEGHGEAAPARRVDLPLDLLASDLVHEVEQVVADAGGDAVAGAVAAQLAEGPRHGLEGRDVEDVGALGRDDRVQHQRLDVGRVLGGVVEGDLGAIGDAEEHELLVAGLDAQGLDVVDRIGGAVEAARRPELIGARRGGVDDRPDAALEGRAGEAARAARAALVVDEQVARGQRRAEDRGELADDGDRRLPRTAGQRDDRGGGRVARGHGALDVERQRAGDRARAVERHRELPALKARGFAWRIGDGRVGARSEDEGHHDGRESGEGGPGAHGRAG